MSTTIRIDDETKTRIDELATQLGIRTGALVARAIDELERATFFDNLNSRYSELRDDPQAWRSVTKERDVESRATADDVQE